MDIANSTSLTNKRDLCTQSLLHQGTVYSTYSNNHRDRNLLQRRIPVAQDEQTSTFTDCSNSLLLQAIKCKLKCLRPFSNIEGRSKCARTKTSILELAH